MPLLSNNPGPNRLGALRRFAFAITALTVVGQTVLGFEQAYFQHVVAVLVAYTLDLILETLRARQLGNAPRFLGGGFRGFVDFLLPAHIAAIATSFLLYANDRYWPVAFASALAIASKYLVRVRHADGRYHHVLNPSNTAILLTLLFFPEVSVTPPWMFLADVSGRWDLVVPAVIFCTGTFLNFRFTRRLPLIIAWLVAFIGQGVARWAFFDAELGGALVAASGPVAFQFTFYMITDPGTTPVRTRNQVAFGASVGLLYGVLVVAHVVFALFWALFIVCCLRGVFLQFFAHRDTQKSGSDHIATMDPAGSDLAV